MFKIGRSTFLYFGGAATAAALGVAMVVPDGTTSLRAKGADLLQVLQSRSPGDRASGAVTNKGPRKIAAAAPTYRVLPASVGEPEPADTPATPAAPASRSLPLGAAAPLVAVPAAAVPAIAGAPAVAAATIPPAAGLVGLVPAVPILAGGGGGGSGITPSAAPPTGGGTTPTPAVPEPQTWLMMILGFGILGTALRRRKRSVADSRMTSVRAIH